MGLQHYLSQQATAPAPEVGKGRIRRFYIDGTLKATPSEQAFHLMGFVDAIAWMGRNGYIDEQRVHAESDLSDELLSGAEEWGERELSNVVTDETMIAAATNCDTSDSRPREIPDVASEILYMGEYR